MYSRVLKAVAAILLSGISMTAQGQPGFCGDPPPVQDESLKGEISGKAQFLSRFLGDAALSGQIETARNEIFSKYPYGERANAYFQYQVCILLTQDTSMSTVQKLEELKKIQREFIGPPEIHEGSGSAETAIDHTLVPRPTRLDFRFRQSTINGVFYTNALVMSVHRPSRIEINAGRSRSRFLGDLGVPDNQRSESAYQVDVSLDNAAPVFSTDVRFGETKRLDLDVTNVLRIRISISPIAGSPGYLAIGNPRFR